MTLIIEVPEQEHDLFSDIKGASVKSVQRKRGSVLGWRLLTSNNRMGFIHLRKSHYQEIPVIMGGTTAV